MEVSKVFRLVTSVFPSMIEHESFILGPWISSFSNRWIRGMKLCSNRTHLMERKMVVTNFVNRGVGPFVPGMLLGCWYMFWFPQWNEHLGRHLGARWSPDFFFLGDQWSSGIAVSVLDGFAICFRANFFKAIGKCVDVGRFRSRVDILLCFSPKGWAYCIHENIQPGTRKRTWLIY